MKKLLLPLLVILLFAACKKVITTNKAQEEIGSVAAKGPAIKIDVCHKGHTISINLNAWPTHQSHGDLLGDCSAVLTTTICNQTWMVRNLDVSTYRNGDPIPQVIDPSEWFNLTTGAWCYYNNDPANGPIYGKLYNWFAVNDPRGLAPAGWHVPTVEEFTTLSTCLGGDPVAGGKMKETGTAHWLAPNTDATNSSGFTALPGGFRFSTFELIGQGGEWWSSTEEIIVDPGIAAWRYNIDYNGGYLGYSNTFKQFGASVRCVRD